MSLDQYSFCPCGNGKKIKFCKCHNHLAEMQKLARMIEGNQLVAALDQMNSLMKAMPSEPWLMAMKCQVLALLRETEKFEEASAKFIRLQPDNNLAKLNRAYVAINHGNYDEAASLVLQSHSVEAVEPFFVSILNGLIDRLVLQHTIAPAMALAEFGADVGGESAEHFQDLISNIANLGQNVSLLERESLPSPSQNVEPAYEERFQEASVLLNNYKIPQARSRIDSILREFGPVSPVLALKLRCQLLTVDMQGAAETSRQLSHCDDLLIAQRVYYRALGIDLAPHSSRMGLQMDRMIFEVDDGFEQRMLSDSRLVPITDEDQIFRAIIGCGEEVPPKHSFYLTCPVEIPGAVDRKPAVAVPKVCYFGRQTDKPPRILLNEFPPSFFKTHVDQFKSDMQLDESKKHKAVSPDGVSTSAYLLPASIFHVQLIDLATQSVKITEGEEQSILNWKKNFFLDQPLEVFDGKTPREASSDKKYEIDLRALMLNLEANDSRIVDQDHYPRMVADLGLTPLLMNPEDDVLDLVGGAAYIFIDYSKIGAQDLTIMANSALQRAVCTQFKRIRNRLRELGPAAIGSDYKLLELQFAVNVEVDFNVLEKLYLELYNLIGPQRRPIGQLVVYRSQLLSVLGKTQEAQQFIAKAFETYPNDPELLALIEQKMQTEQRSRRPRFNEGAVVDEALSARGEMGSGSAAPQGSGLWTPDQGSPDARVPSGASAEGGGSGGSGLWLPGQ